MRPARFAAVLAALLATGGALPEAGARQLDVPEAASVARSTLPYLTADPSPASFDQEALDRRVEHFLQENQRAWRDANVAAVDGQKLFDLIVENGYTRAVEVGTSTGHSGIWIAWALSKTGGKLLTIEIDRGRYDTAVANFEEAGLSPWIDARLADAHELVPELEGPFDFVFVDADKDWYTQYFRWLLPKLEDGGCFTAHNVSDVTSSSSRRRRRGGGMAPDFVRELLETPGLTTEFFTGGGGLSVSFRRGSAEARK